MKEPCFGSPEEIRLFEVLHRLRRLGRQFSLGTLSRGEHMVLHVLGKSETAVSVSALAAKLHVSQPAVSRSLRGLEEKGLLLRASGESDRRSTVVQMTEEGRQTYERANKELHAFWHGVMTDFQGENVRQLTKLLEKLGDHIEERMGDS